MEEGFWRQAWQRSRKLKMQKVETGTESIAKQDYSGKKKDKCSLGKEWVERWKGNYHVPGTHYVPGVCLHRLLILRCPAQQAAPAPFWPIGATEGLPRASVGWGGGTSGRGYMWLPGRGPRH